ncbi:MAG: ribonuclease [Micromonosporaceae bacterium]
MLENEPTGEQTAAQPAGDAGGTGTTRRARPTRRRTTKAAAEPATTDSVEPAGGEQPSSAPDAENAPPARASRRRRRAADTDEPGVSTQEAQEGTEAPAPRSRRRKAATSVAAPVAGEEPGAAPVPPPAEAVEAPPSRRRKAPAAATVLFMAPEVPVEPVESRAADAGAAQAGGVEPGGPAPRATRSRAAASRAGGSRPAESRGAESRGPESRGAESRGAESRGAESRGAESRDEAEEAGETGRSRSRRRSRRTPEPVETAAETGTAEAEEAEDTEDDDEYEMVGGRRRRRRGRRGRGRGRGTHGEEFGEDDEPGAEAAGEEPEAEEEAEADEPLTRRRRRRRRGSSANEATETAEDGVVTVVKVRQPRAPRDEVQGVSGSTRLEAKRQRRRDGREQRRTRPPILSESEFLARREAVDRAMVIRERGDRTQIGVLEDGVLVEHYVTRASTASMVGNVYLGKVQNVLPSMEAAFVDIGRGRNAVLYAGEVNWDATGLEGRARSIEQALKSGDSVLVQVTKDPIGHKGARLSSHIALSGRHLVYVPHGNASGISRKLPDNERRRLRDVLKDLIPDGAGVIVRTAAEGAAADELERDVTRLQAQWSDIQAKAAEGGAPVLLYEEPDLVIRVVRDLFNEDFKELVIQGPDAYEMVEMYLKHVSPDLVPRLHRHTGRADVFVERRIDEQILKGLDRKVYLPSGGSLVIDRTEAMTVIDVNTGKYTGTGGNLEETVTRNNLEAAEEIVRQLRLRDQGGIIVIDFIDMVLESNRDLVLRRLTECLGRDRTKHQVTEITSLGLVQMTRKRIGQGLLEAFSETCEHCKGRGLIIHTDPVSERRQPAKVAPEPVAAPTGRRRGRRGAAAVPATAEPDQLDEEAPALAGAEWAGTGRAAVAPDLADDDLDSDDDSVERLGSDDLAERLGSDDLAERLGSDDLADEDLAEDDLAEEDLLDTIEADAAEDRGDSGEAEFEPIGTVPVGENGHFRASADDPDAVDSRGDGVPGTSAEPASAVLGGRRRVIWASRRRTRP